MGWNPFKAIQRAFTPPSEVRTFISNATKITGESFQPAEIARVGSAAAITVNTGGLSLFNPTIGKTTIVSSDPNKASVVGAALVGANSFGTVQSGNPDVPETTINQIARKIGGAISAIAVGNAASNVLTTPASAHALPPGVQGPPEGLSIGERFGNFGATAISGSASAYGTGTLAHTVIQIFGQKVGGAILQIFNGDLGGAIKTITTPTPHTPTTTTPNLFGNFQSGGGGAGLGVASKSNVGQLGINPVWFPIMGISVIVVVWLWVRRK